jgi:carbonic anhydrase
MYRPLALASLLALSFFFGYSALAVYVAHPEGEVKWSYDKDYTGQEEWGLLTKEFAACDIGTHQSPIHIGRTEISYALPELEFFYFPAKTTARDAGYTLKLYTHDERLTLTEGNKRYILHDVHFHTPSEHIIKDKFYALEIHLVHQDMAGSMLVVSVFADMDTPLKDMDFLLDHSPTKANEDVPVAFNPAMFLPESKEYYAYTGSLTTPPCTEGVQWRIMKEPISISKQQLVRLSEHTARNARLTQPVYMRTVYESKALK